MRPPCGSPSCRGRRLAPTWPAPWASPPWPTCPGRSPTGSPSSSPSSGRQRTSASPSSRPRSRKPSRRRAERSLLRWGPPDEGSPPCCVVWARFQRGFYVSGSQPGLTSWKLPPQKPVMKTQSRGDLTDTTAWFVIGQGVMSMDSCHLLTIEASNLYLIKSVS